MKSPQGTRPKPNVERRTEKPNTVFKIFLFHTSVESLHSNLKPNLDASAVTVWRISFSSEHPVGDQFKYSRAR